MNCVTCGRSHFRFKDREHTTPASLCMGCRAAYIRDNRPKPPEVDVTFRHSPYRRPIFPPGFT